MYNNQWPNYLSLQVVNNIRCLRSSANTRLITPLEKDAFQDSAAIFFLRLSLVILQLVKILNNIAEWPELF